MLDYIYATLRFVQKEEKRTVGYGKAHRSRYVNSPEFGPCSILLCRVNMIMIDWWEGHSPPDEDET